MAKILRYISISHKTASVRQREKFYIAHDQKEEVMALLRNRFPDISGLLLLVTCNRTEVYFEAEATSATSLLRFMVSHLLGEESSDNEQLFTTSDSTETSVRHLLEVSSGLVSKVLGDAEIVCQVKKAYQLAIAHSLQGSLLERAMQTVFRTHKRIRNETLFRDGTTSAAYKALKMIVDTFGKTAVNEKKLLFVGAGDIVKQLFKYNVKFGFEHIFISNRTKSKALMLTDRYLGDWYDWEKVLSNDFENFDVIISAASNCPNLITKISGTEKTRMLIDLALPGNIDPGLNDPVETMFYDLDTISTELEENREKRLAAINQVNAIKEEELSEFKKWYQEAPLRELLGEYKITLNQKIKRYLRMQQGPMDEGKIKLITDRVIRKLVMHGEGQLPPKKMDVLIEQQANLL
ncbi:glutamyl-tRNA reductase [Flagellimonas meishanensis]|uniref:glutamyl-tRNA reductase n=1 Tax=Flagellimonas meishanensis TaxID=2873264 RepID=UPI001CA660E7|nr:glutamyl-tRNA reductase [[Muricauda] meishanensis]